MRTVIFDDNGCMWDTQSPALYAEFYGVSCDFDLIAYLIDNLGFVELQYKRPDAARLRLHPETASSAAIAAAIFAVWDDCPTRIVISTRGARATDMICMGPSAATAHIASLVANAQNQTHQRFISKSVSPREALDARDPLAKLLDLWVSSLGHFCPEDHSELFDGSLQGRCMIVEAGQNRDLRISQVGHGFRAYSPQWCRNAIGLPLENQPDYAYGLWVREKFESVAERWTARLDDVDVMLNRPHLNDMIRSRYRRLILPYRDTSTNTDRLIGASMTDETIDFQRTMSFNGA